MIALVLVLGQIDPLPPPPPPEPGKFQPAQPAPQAAPQAAPRPAPRPPPPSYAPPSSAPPRAAPQPYVKPDYPTPTPLAHRGFQLGIRTGVALPAGRLSDSTAMAELTAVQIPVFLDIGAKVSRHVFIGGYGSFGLGGTTERWKRGACSANDGCASRSIHLGAELQYHFAPSDLANPWLGFGFGYEWLWTVGAPETTYRGPEYARFMAGLDFRLSHDFGLGPFVDATLASYRDRTIIQQSRGPNLETGEATIDVPDPALHSWVTVGLRFVLFP